MRITVLLCLALTALALTAGGARAERVIALSADGKMRLLANPGCTGSACQWVDIDNNPRSISVAATDGQVFQLHDNGGIWRWRELPCAGDSCPSWTRIDNNPQGVAIAADEDDLFQLHRDGSIWRWLGGDCDASRCSSWERLDRNPNTRAIVAAGTLLFQLRANGSVWRWRGAPCAGDVCPSWEQLDSNPATREIDYAARGALFQRHENGSLWRWDGRPCTGASCPSWSLIDRNPQTVDILAAPGNLFQRHGNGAVWRWRGRVCEGLSCPHWSRIGQNAQWVAIAAGPQPIADAFSGAGGGAAPVYAVAANGGVSRWAGASCGATCADWTPMGAAFTRFSPTRGGLFVFVGDPPNVNARIVLIPARPNDADGDGLPDAWERARTAWGLNPQTANLIFVPVFRPDVMEDPELVEIANRNIDRMKQFLRDLPVHTERGRRGIHVVVRPGNPLSEFYREDATPMLEYRSARVGMPAELIGYAHGMLIGVGTRGGGQTSGPDWSGVSNDFFTMIHELGHQLELEHEPGGSGTPSPLYTSLLNYDYNYQFNGSADLVHYSRGKFAGIRLNERRLDEILPFPETDLAFLRQAPYNFTVEARGPANTMVDWNRNGVHAERGISADINDGYALNVASGDRINPTTGDMALTAQGDILVALTTEIPRADLTAFSGFGANPTTSAYLTYATVRDRSVLRTGRLTDAPIMTGAPSATQVGGRILVAFPVAIGRVRVGVYTIAVDGSLSGTLRSVDAGGHRQVALVNTAEPNTVALLLWDPETNRLEARRIDPTGATVRIDDPQPILRADTGAQLLSTIPPGAVLNTRTNRIMLAAGENDGAEATNRLRLWTLEASPTGWRASGARWLGSPNVRSPDRPAIVFDASARAGGDGRYLVYYREHPGPDSEGLARLIFVRVTPPNTSGTAADAPYVTRAKMYINEWTISQNAPAATPYRDDFAVLWRVGHHFPAVVERNRAELNHKTSGEFSEGPADFDDITHIAQTGLWRSITNLRP